MASPASPGGDPSRVPTAGSRPRPENVLTVFDLIVERGVTTRAEIARVTGLSLPTVTRVVSYLMARGLLRQVRYVRGSVGRRAGMVEVDPASAHVAGVDVGELHIRAALADVTGQVLSTVQVPTGGEKGVHSVLQRVAAAIEDVCRQAGHRPAVIAVGYPGIVDEGSGVVRAAPAIAGSEGFTAYQELQHAFPGAVVIVHNDVNLAALGECWRGAAGDHRDRGTVVFLSFRTGIGAGIVMNGKLYRGARGGAGEVGYLCGDTSFELAGPGAPGWVETRAGGVALARAYAEAARGSCVAGACGVDGPNLESVVDACGAGDATAGHLMAGALDHYGLVLANVAAVLDPDLVVLGGVLPALGPRALERVVEAARTKLPWLPEARLSRLGLEATMYGAVYQALAVAVELTRVQIAGPALERPETALDAMARAREAVRA